MAATASSSSSSSSSSFLTLRGVAEDLSRSRSSSARPGRACTSSVALRRTGASGFVRAAIAATPSPPPSRLGGAISTRRDETTALSTPIAFDPLGVRVPSTSGGGGLYLWGRGEAAEKMMRRPTTNDQDRPPVSAERLDRWIRGSVTEIVKRIEEAPFLSFIFANDDDSTTDGLCLDSSSSTASTVRIEREAAEPDDWPSIQRRWGSSSSTSTAPDGIILVEELKGKSESGDQEQGVVSETKNSAGGGGNGLGSAATRMWGVLVQGRGGGADCTACYILRTCRVWSAAGCCTHFCLVRAQCFGESAEAQLRNAWIAYGGRH